MVIIWYTSNFENDVASHKRRTSYVLLHLVFKISYELGVGAAAKDLACESLPIDE